MRMKAPMQQIPRITTRPISSSGDTRRFLGSRSPMEIDEPVRGADRSCCSMGGAMVAACSMCSMAWGRLGGVRSSCPVPVAFGWALGRAPASPRTWSAAGGWRARCACHRRQTRLIAGAGSRVHPRVRLLGRRSACGGQVGGEGQHPKPGQVLSMSHSAPREGWLAHS